MKFTGYFFACPFEAKLVRFHETKNVLRGILRVIGGAILYFGLNIALKMPFSSEFFSSPTMPAFIVRSVRYAIIIFILSGVYPMMFDKVEKNPECVRFIGWMNRDNSSRKNS